MRRPVARSMGRVEWALLILLSVLWGGSFFFAEIAIRAVPPFAVVLGRVGIAALVLVVAVYATGRRLPGNAAAWRDYLVMGLLNNAIPFSLIFWGQTQISSGLAAILNATTPLFTVVLAHFLTADETLTQGRIIGVLLGIAGVAAMIGPGALAAFGLYDMAQICVLGAAVSYAFAGIYGRRFAASPPLVTAAGQLCASTVLILPFVVFGDLSWLGSALDAAAWGSILGLALLCTAVPYVLYFRVLAAAGASNLLLVTFLIPVSAILLGAVFLGERLGSVEIVGMALIAAGMISIDGRIAGFRHRKGRTGDKARKNLIEF